jgi:ADP-ribose pyrophosphatase YjhB (NUDIX family)
MPQQEYAIALDYLVFTCVDLALTCQGEILLAQRNHYPRKSWWLLGGRMVAGESPLDTATRKLAEEAHLFPVAPERFRYVGVYSTCFAQRQQEPVQHGSHSVNLTFQVELTPDEAGRLSLNEEYAPGWKWVNIEDVGLLLTDTVMDQALRQVIADIRATPPSES